MPDDITPPARPDREPNPRPAPDNSWYDDLTESGDEVAFGFTFGDPGPFPQSPHHGLEECDRDDDEIAEGLALLAGRGRASVPHEAREGPLATTTRGTQPR